MKKPKTSKQARAQVRREILEHSGRKKLSGQWRADGSGEYTYFPSDHEQKAGARALKVEWLYAGGFGVRLH